jgi:tRNA/tmRNA/rRNA uracil-C5-methylase (TrmA/RlmC/RlmD family)
LRDLITRLIPGDQELLIDAYCGAGFFAKRLLEKFERIIGIDWDKFAIVAAMENATAKETYIAGDVEDELSRALAVAAPLGRGAARGRLGSIAPTFQADAMRTTVIVDPPATGLTAKTRRAIADHAPGTFIYISCNPSMLARDLAELQQSFTIDSVTPLDMFPQTAEIEVAVHLRTPSALAS